MWNMEAIVNINMRVYDIDYQETNHIEDKYRELLKKQTLR